MSTIVVDSNLLCLIVAGQFAPSAIGRHKRLKAYEIDDYEKVTEICSHFTAAATCPNVLTEVSNLLSQTNETEKSILLNGLKSVTETIKEHHTPSFLACGNRYFERLGITDAVLLTMDIVDGALLTVDLELALAAQSSGKKVVNYNWIRDQTISCELLQL